MIGVHKAANSHSSLHCCGCSCSLSGHMIIWSRTDLQIGIRGIIMYRLESENFLLEFNPTVYENDLSFAVNTSLGIKVFSYGFSADSVMDIDVRGLAGFSISLNRLYETLKGSARLEDPYGVHSYIEFIACSGGHIKVKGSIHNGNAYGYEQELAFENELDQTYLKSFVKALFDDYKKYVER